MLKHPRIFVSIVAASALALAGCSNSEQDSTQNDSAPETAANASAESDDDIADDADDALDFEDAVVRAMAEDADMAATDGKVSVKCNLIYDAEQMTPLYVLYTQGRGLYPTPLRHRLTSTTLSMTPGKYCIYAQFTKYNPNLSDNGQYDFFTPITLVLKEVEITEDTTLDFDVATAVNLVRFEAINRNDEPLILPLYKDKKLDYSQSNVRSTWRSSSLFHPVYGEVHTLTGNDGYRMEDGRAGNHAFNFMINDVSDD